MYYNVGKCRFRVGTGVGFVGFKKRGGKNAMDVKNCLIFGAICALLLGGMVPLPMFDRFNIWCTAKITRRFANRRTRRQAKDAANPERIEQRERYKVLRSKVSMYAFFITVLLLLPIGGIVLGIQQRFAGNEAWALIIAACLQGGLGAWMVVISATASKDKQKHK